MYRNQIIILQKLVSHFVTHFYMTSWSDKNAPSGVTDLLELRDKVKAAERPDASPAVIVHCRSDKYNVKSLTNVMGIYIILAKGWNFSVKIKSSNNTWHKFQCKNPDN